LVKPTSGSTPTEIELEVTPWSVAPDALPPWQTLASVPKSPAVEEPEEPDALDEDDEAGAPELELVLVVPARLQPAARSPATAMAARVLVVCRKVGFLLLRGVTHAW
jgi:hypothetical protein